MKSFFKKIISLLNSKQKKTIIFLIFLMFIGMIFETLGIGLIIPAFTIITDPTSIGKYSSLMTFWSEDWMFNASQMDITQTQLIFISIAIVVSVYILKTIFLVYLSWRQSNFIKNVSLYWSHKLFSGYLHLPYSFHLQTNSNYLLQNIKQSTVLASAVESCLILATEILVVSGIGTLLLIVEPIGALTVIFVITFCSYFFYFYTRKHLSKWGKKRHFHDVQKLKHGRQSFDGVKDLKLFGGEKNFLEQWAFHNIGSAQIDRNQKVLQVLPRLWLELVTILGLATLLAVMVIQDKSISSIIPVLGVFAAAAFRIMPSVNRILGSIQRLRFQLPVTDIIHKELTEKIARNEISKQKLNLSFKKSIEIDNIDYTYESRSHLVLSNIKINIPIGSQVGFVGESGSGKTTLVDIMLGLLSPTKGFIKIDGTDIHENLRSWQKQIGYVPQSIYLTDDTLFNNVAFGLNNGEILEKDVNEAIKGANLDTFVNNLPEGLNTMVGERGVRLSGGQRQRVGIARALYRKPKILVLDEATSSLDTETEKEIMKEVSNLKKNKTVIIIAHRLSTVSNCDQLYKLDKGKIIKEGSFEEVVS